MKHSVACLLLIVVAIGYTRAEEPECIPGETIEEGCNSCFCTDNGILACTLKECPPVKKTCKPRQTIQKECNICVCTNAREFVCTTMACKNERGEEKCSPGEVKKQDCNTCTCTSSGVFGCTRELCLKKRAAAECKPGDTKKVECNTCTCANGVFACTRKLCISKREAISARFSPNLPRSKREEFSCVPGQTFSRECNTCTCTPDGKNAICTLKACF